MPFYKLLVLIHIFSAILGMGPGFILIYIAKNPRNLTELRLRYKLRKKLHIFVMIGGTLLLLTGLTMGYLNPALFQAFWYVSSLTLYIIALGFGPILLSPRVKPIRALLRELEGEKIPKVYFKMAKSLFFWERIENVIFLFIITLMILKPYSLEILLKMLYLK